MADETKTTYLPRGRKSRYAGKLLTPATSENHRQAGSHGHASFQLLLDSPEGMTYEEYMAAGGRANDLHWDVEREKVIVADQ